jgi:hypothetical protein
MNQFSGLERWQKIARRIRVPLGFAFAALYLWQAFKNPPHLLWILASLLLVLPGLWLRGYASGYVKKNAELTTTGPYAHTRNPLYLGSMLIAFGFALALASWMIALALVLLFVVIYVPVIASEERFLRANFDEFNDYCRRVPRLLPRLTSAVAFTGGGSFSIELYSKHREYNAAIGAGLVYAALLTGLLLR